MRYYNELQKKFRYGYVNYFYKKNIMLNYSMWKLIIDRYLSMSLSVCVFVAILDGIEFSSNFILED